MLSCITTSKQFYAASIEQLYTGAKVSVGAYQRERMEVYPPKLLACMQAHERVKKLAALIPRLDLKLGHVAALQLPRKTNDLLSLAAYEDVRWMVTQMHPLDLHIHPVGVYDHFGPAEMFLTRVQTTRLKSFSHHVPNCDLKDIPSSEIVFVLLRRAASTLRDVLLDHEIRSLPMRIEQWPILPELRTLRLGARSTSATTPTCSLFSHEP